MAAPPFPPGHEARIAACIHCGFCLETCPTFVETGREEESPRGRLTLAMGLATGRWTAESTVLDPLDSCLGCRACEGACPSGVAYGRILEDVRATTEPVRGRPRNRWERVLVKHVLGRGPRLALGAAFYRRLGLWAAARWMARLPFVPPGLGRRLRLAPRPEPLPPPPVLETSDGPPAHLLRGCVARHLFPDTEAAMIRLLDRAGYTVRTVGRPVCCGALAQHLGDRDQARRLGRQLLGGIGDTGILVPTAAGCGAHLKGLAHLFEGEPEEATAQTFAGRVRDLTEALEAAPRPLAFRTEASVSVVYHDACHLSHGQNLTEPPRRLLRSAGATLHEVEEAELCCGSAGTYNLAREEMGFRLGTRKAAALRAGGAPVVVTANPGCAIQLAAHLDSSSDPGVTTLALFLASRL